MPSHTLTNYLLTCSINKKQLHLNHSHNNDKKKKKKTKRNKTFTTYKRWVKHKDLLQGKLVNKKILQLTYSASGPQGPRSCSIHNKKSFRICNKQFFSAMYHNEGIKFSKLKFRKKT